MKCQSKDRLPSLQGYAFTIIQKPWLCGSDQNKLSGCGRIRDTCSVGL